MRDGRFEWNDDKARSNFAEHKITFEIARRVFDDPHAETIYDDRIDYGEDRYNRIGMIFGRLVTVCYTERGKSVRIISARKANKREQNTYFKRGR